MRRSTGLTRFLWRLTALLQIVLPPFVVVADAQLERDAMSARAYSHVESKTGKDCAPVHTPDCALCQHISSFLAKPPKPPAPVQIAQPEAPRCEGRVAPFAATSRHPSLPRAPPVV
jgi:hypothetical protein